MANTRMKVRKNKEKCRVEKTQEEAKAAMEENRLRENEPRGTREKLQKTRDELKRIELEHKKRKSQMERDTDGRLLSASEQANLRIGNVTGNKRKEKDGARMRPK